MKKNDKEKELEKISRMGKTHQQIALAALLSACFEEYNVDLTVVGGAAVQYYSHAEYVTKDLDAILRRDTKEIIEEVMAQFNFKRTTMYRHFEHPLFPFVVEFPPSPVEVGSRLISHANLLSLNNYAVKIIKVEDIIMDRIIAGIEWKSERSLSQAKLLWQKNKNIIDKKYLKKFAKEEGYEKTLREIMRSSRPASQGSR